MALGLRSFLSAQLGHPSGWFARHVLSRSFNRINADNLRRTVARLQVERTHAVLDVGFGGGASLQSLLELARDGHVCGLDHSRELVELAQQRFAASIAAGKLEVRVGDAGALPWPEHSFDRLCTVNTIYFWEDLPAIFREFHRVLRPGGRCVVCFSSPETLAASWFTSEGLRRYEPSQVVSALDSAGFHDVTTELEDEHQRFDTVLALARA